MTNGPTADAPTNAVDAEGVGGGVLVVPLEGNADVASSVTLAAAAAAAAGTITSPATAEWVGKGANEDGGDGIGMGSSGSIQGEASVGASIGWSVVDAFLADNADDGGGEAEGGERVEFGAGSEGGCVGGEGGQSTSASSDIVAVVAVVAVAAVAVASVAAASVAAASVAAASVAVASVAVASVAAAVANDVLSVVVVIIALHVVFRFSVDQTSVVFLDVDIPLMRNRRRTHLFLILRWEVVKG